MQENIKNIKVGNNIEGFYLLDTMTVKSISGGRSTIMLATLRDETGSIGAKIWNYDGPVTSNDAGNVVYVEGGPGSLRPRRRHRSVEGHLQRQRQHPGSRL